MPSAPPRVAAIVCNYNAKEITIQAVRSLLRMDYSNFEVVVVDNASTDGSFEAVATVLPGVRQLRVDANRGSSSGYTRGFNWAIEQRFDYALMLNNDIEVDRGMLSELVRVAESDSTIGVVGPKCLFHADPDRIWSAGGELRFREAITSERGCREIDRGQYDQDAEVDYINGTAILVRREAALAAGGWDPLYATCVDDADFCTRIRRAGYRCFYAYRARLWHMVALTLGGYVASRTSQVARSTAIYVRRYASPWQWLTYLLWTAAALPLAFLRELPSGNQAAVLAKLRGIRDGLRADLSDPPLFARDASADAARDATGSTSASAPTESDSATLTL